MPGKKTEKTRLKFLVSHCSPGRLRLKVNPFSLSKDDTSELQKRLGALDYVVKADVRPTTGSIIVHYDSKQMERKKLIALLGQDLKTPLTPLHTPLHDVDPGRGPRPAPARRSSRHLLFHLANMVFMSGFLVFAFIRRFVSKAPLSESPFSLAGVLASAGAVPLLIRAVRELRDERRFGLFSFLTLGCVLAIGLGAAFTALEIIWVLSIGMFLEGYAAERARKTIRDIFRMSDNTAFILVGGVEVETPVAELQAGDSVVVRSGQMIPVDGVVIQGKALVDEAHITGRSLPELRGSNDHVYAGTKLQQGDLTIRAEKVGDATYLARIFHMVEESMAEPSEVEKKADILAGRLINLGMASTVGTLLLTRSLTRSFSVMLVMTCPCATILAASTAIGAAIANAGRKNILIKGGAHLEQLDTIDIICFDKTGTITTDVPRLVQVTPRAPKQDPNTIVALAASAEASSSHPMAKALLAEARDRKLSLNEASKYETHLGRGVQATIDSDLILVGNRRFMESREVDTSYYKSRARKHMESGHTVLYVAKNGKLQGMLAMTNMVRPGAERVLEQLRKDGNVRLFLISGDMEPIVKTISGQLGFDEYRAPLLPEEKARLVEDLKSSGGKVMMVGDGVNDALALSKASVGVGMGAGGSEVAIEASDIALVNDELEGLIFLRDLSRKTLDIIEQNFWIATFTNIAGIVLGAAGWFSPLMAGMLHAGHTLGIMANSGRLFIWDGSKVQLLEK